MDNHKANTSKRASIAKQATNWIADQFSVTKAIKEKDKKNTKAGKDAG